MKSRLLQVLAAPVRVHFFGSLALVVVVSAVISTQITDRRNFASSELHHDVIERWGAPIVQPVPSVRWVESGAVFNTLEAMPFDKQVIAVNAAMNYRKRGLVYFSGFDFDFRGSYAVTNREAKDVDLVFVFPINLQRNKVLLSELAFTVNGAPTSADLGPSSDRLTWTGRLGPGEALDFEIRFKGRGLDSFVYQLDPELPVRNLELTMNIEGGENFDYADGVVPATKTQLAKGKVDLEWRYASLESGVPIGVILPAEKAYDQVIATMVRRAWATFILFFVAVVALAVHRDRPLRIHESYLLASSYGFFFVLLAYLAAYLPFYAAYVVSLLIIGGLIHAYLRWTLGELAGVAGLYLVGAFLAVPTGAVILQGYTGLIYSLEILSGLAALMFFTTRAEFRGFVDRLLVSLSWEAPRHAS
jgi:hypothetical protein